MEKPAIKNAARGARLLEIPFLFATALDSLTGQKRWTLQKHRQKLSGMGGRGFSLGRRGKVQLANPPMLSCLASAGAQNPEFAQDLCSAYRDAGIDELVESPAYHQTLEIAERSIRDQAASCGARPSMVELAGSLATLYKEYADVREVTDHLHSIMAEVDERLPEVENLPGRLVRIEGSEALVVIEGPGGRHLESHPASYLKALGVVDTDAPFILQRLRHRPGNRLEIFFPAFDPDRAQADDDLDEVYQPLEVSREALAAFGLLDEAEAPVAEASSPRAPQAD